MVRVTEICAKRMTGGRGNGASNTVTSASPYAIRVGMVATANAVPVIEGEPQRIWAVTLEICGAETESAALAQEIGGAKLPSGGVLAAGLPS